MATEGKTPLKDAATSSPQRSDKTADRSRVARNRIIAGIVVAVIAIVGIFLLTRGGGGSPASSLSEPPPGAVDFQSKGITFVPYQLHGDQNAQKATAHEAANKIRLALDALFQTAYVAPDTWGDTGQIQDFFTAGAQPALEGDIGTLTLGQNAGDTYDRVDPVKKKSTIVVNVLTDAKGNAARASAKISFVGTATRSDGTTSTITVTGTVILVPDGDTWKIEAYRLNRSEKPTQAASTSPTAEAS